MKQAILDLFSSKRFLMLLAALICALGGKFGLQLDNTTVAEIVGLFAVAIGAQGAADHGKEAAKINVAAAQAMNDNAPAPAKIAQAGFASFGLLIFLAFFALIVGCAWFKSESKAVASDVVDCTVSTATSNIKQFGPVLDALLVYATDGGGKINGDAVKAATTGFAKEVGGCVLADTIARALKPAPTDPNAPKSSPLVADPSSLRATLAGLYPGVRFHTAAGDI